MILRDMTGDLVCTECGANFTEFAPPHSGKHPEAIRARIMFCFHNAELAPCTFAWYIVERNERLLARKDFEPSIKGNYSSKSDDAKPSGPACTLLF
jgi:hypothetical protein